MGYTHYWYQSRDLTDDEWQTICQKSQELFESNKTLVANGMGDKGISPEINDDEISFNGIGDDSHETCFVTKNKTFNDWEDKKGESFSFCKTAHKPYDKVVVQFLKMIRDVTGNAFRLSSDGEGVFD